MTDITDTLKRILHGAELRELDATEQRAIKEAIREIEKLRKIIETTTRLT